MVCRPVGAKPLSKPQCWNIVNWTLGNKHQWHFNRNLNIFIQENAFEYVVCEMVSICLGLSVLIRWLLAMPDNQNLTYGARLESPCLKRGKISTDFVNSMWRKSTEYKFLFFQMNSAHQGWAILTERFAVLSPGFIVGVTWGSWVTAVFVGLLPIYIIIPFYHNWADLLLGQHRVSLSAYWGESWGDLCRSLATNPVRTRSVFSSPWSSQ